MLEKNVKNKNMVNFFNDQMLYYRRYLTSSQLLSRHIFNLILLYQTRNEITLKKIVNFIIILSKLWIIVAQKYKDYNLF